MPDASHDESRATAAIRLPGMAVRWAPAVLAFAAVRLYLIVAAAAHGFDGMANATWSRWDSNLYVSIAVEGYSFGISDGHNSRYPAGVAIGNAGWMPGYPLLIRLAHGMGVPPLAAGAGLSAVFAFLSLVAIDRLTPAGEPFARRLLVLLLAAFFPGFVYAHAVFPISMAVLLLALSVRATASGRWWAGGLFGAGAAFTYTSGYVIGSAMGAWAVLPGRGPAGRLGPRVVRMLGPALLPLAGVAAAIALQRAGTGRWDALFRVQAKYGFQPTNPARTVARFLSFATSEDRSLAAAVLQVAAVTLLWAAAVGTAVAGWTRRSAGDRLLAVAAVAYWVVPLSLGPGLSPWRTMAMMTPFVPPLARRLPRTAQVVALVVFLALGWAMCGRFLDGSAI